MGGKESERREERQVSVVRCLVTVETDGVGKKPNYLFLAKD